jgi:hypothetical protein
MSTLICSCIGSVDMQQKTQVIVSMALIESYITDSKISKLAALLREEHQKDQVRRMFVYYNTKGWSSKTQVKIVYKDSDMLVTRSLSGYSKTSGKPYHAMWALGITEDQVWIHRLPWSHNIENNTYTWTLQEVRKIMGFVEDLEKQTVLEVGKAVRVQGDISIMMRATLERYYEKISERETPKVAKGFDEYLFKMISDKTTNQRQEMSKKYDEDINTVKGLSLKKRNKKETELLKAMKKEYGLMSHHLLSLLIERIELIKNGHETKFIKGLMEGFDKEKQKYIQTELELMKSVRRARQINLRLGNHIVIIENGQESDLVFPESVVVYENTQCFIIHDEHSSKHLYLNPGVYTLSMLTRHVTDRR